MAYQNKVYGFDGGKLNNFVKVPSVTERTGMSKSFAVPV